MEEICEEALNKLMRLGQNHLISLLELLPRQQRYILAGQISLIEEDLFWIQKKSLENTHRAPLVPASIEPWKSVVPWGDHRDKEAGIKLLQKGKVGCIALAGGQGSRLGFDKPKGMYPLSAVQNKSLFQMLAEKTRAASVCYGANLFLAVMSSEKDLGEVSDFFFHHKYFGMEAGTLDLFSQSTLPWLDDFGRLISSPEGLLATASDGNGGVFNSFIKSGLLEKWKAKGIETVTIIPIDNALADPWDPYWIGFQQRLKLQAALLCIKRDDPKEKVGVLASVDRRLTVIEYLELSEDQKSAYDALSGGLAFPYANISLLCLSMAAMEMLGLLPATAIPMHLIKKPLFVEPTSMWAWKSERFIFDALPYLHTVRAMERDRASCFAPLKNYEGPDSPQAVRQALMERDKKIFKELTGAMPPPGPIELSADFLYPPQKGE